MSHLPQHGGCWLWLPREQPLKLPGLGESASEWVDKGLQRCWQPAVTLLSRWSRLLWQPCICVSSEWRMNQTRGMMSTQSIKTLHCITTHSITHGKIFTIYKPVTEAFLFLIFLVFSKNQGSALTRWLKIQSHMWCCTGTLQTGKCFSFPVFQLCLIRKQIMAIVIQYEYAHFEANQTYSTKLFPE